MSNFLIFFIILAGAGLLLLLTGKENKTKVKHNVKKPLKKTSRKKKK